MKSRRKEKAENSTFAIRDTQSYNSDLCDGKVNREDIPPSITLHMCQNNSRIFLYNLKIIAIMAKRDGNEDGDTKCTRNYLERKGLHNKENSFYI